MISDIQEILNLYKTKGLLLTVDIEKATKNVLIDVLEIFGFEESFIRLIKILLRNNYHIYLTDK